mmetsp:Transcript_29323/g.84861  ORF Transcript_29323/g.84861 Transcript_29323/m.84861 type:complete len:222 (+) Transcript_29323:729-1394(+)
MHVVERVAELCPGPHFAPDGVTNSVVHIQRQCVVHFGLDERPPVQPLDAGRVQRECRLPFDDHCVLPPHLTPVRVTPHHDRSRKLHSFVRFALDARWCHGEDGHAGEYGCCALAHEEAVDELRLHLAHDARLLGQVARQLGGELDRVDTELTGRLLVICQCHTNWQQVGDGFDDRALAVVPWARHHHRDDAVHASLAALPILQGTDARRAHTRRPAHGCAF